MSPLIGSLTEGVTAKPSLRWTVRLPKFLLDKPPNLCYNKTIREGHSQKPERVTPMTTAMETALRTARLNQIVKALTDAGEEVLFVGTNEITIPCVDADGNEGFVNVKVSVPRGTRNGDGTYDPYDGYAVAEFFANDQKEKAEKKKAMETIRQDITDVSAAMTEKLLGREMSAADHRSMIDEFLKGVGEG